MSRSQIKEVINRNELVSLLLSNGYNAYLPVYDSGIDLIAHNEATNTTLNIQLKSRWGIMSKYLGRNIHIAFPDRGHWYLAPHDEMVAMAERRGHTKTPSWKDKGEFNKQPLPLSQIEEMSIYLL